MIYLKFIEVNLYAIVQLYYERIKNTRKENVPNRGTSGVHLDWILKIYIKIFYLKLVKIRLFVKKLNLKK